MLRNRIIDPDGEIRYLNILCDKRNHFQQEYRNIRTKDFEIWTGRQKGILVSAYKKCRWFEEIWNVIEPVFKIEHEYLCDVTIHSLTILREVFGIRTPLILQSDIEIDKTLKKEQLILGLCKAVGADTYYAGRGASMQYLDTEECKKAGVHLRYQDFQHPVYEQIGSHPFVPGLSALDLLFNNGIEVAREIFWDSVSTSRALD